MFVTALAASSLAMRVPLWVPATAVAAAISLPFGIVTGVVVFGARAWASRRDRHPPVEEAAVCAAIAAELHAGSSLRLAVDSACRNQPSPELVAAGRRAAAGAPAAEVSRLLASALDRNGRHAALAFSLADESGAAAAAVFDRLASRALRDAEIERELAAATAQARLSAVVVGGAPLVVLALLASTGRLGVFAASGAAGVTVAAVGLSFVLAGLGVIWMLLRGDR